MLSGVKNAAAQAARRAALLSAGLLCFAVGVGFLTASAWIILSLAYGSATAAAIIGSAYAGLGLIIVAIALGQGSHHSSDSGLHAATSPQKAPPSDAPPLLQAFMFGVQAGASADKRQAS